MFEKAQMSLLFRQAINFGAEEVAVRNWCQAILLVSIIMHHGGWKERKHDLMLFGFLWPSHIVKSRWNVSSPIQCLSLISAFVARNKNHVYVSPKIQS